MAKPFEIRLPGIETLHRPDGSVSIKVDGVRMYTHDDLEAALETAYARGRQDVLEKVRKLPNPIHKAGYTTEHADGSRVRLHSCAWCWASWTEKYVATASVIHHPDNGCLYVDAHAKEPQ